MLIGTDYEPPSYAQRYELSFDSFGTCTHATSWRYSGSFGLSGFDLASNAASNAATLHTCLYDVICWPVLNSIYEDVA